MKRTLLSLPLVLLTMVGCGSNDPAEETYTSAEAREEVLTNWRLRHGSASGSYTERELRDLLPNHQFAILGGNPEPLADGVVAGRIVKAEPGAGYFSGEDLPTAEVLAFDDPKAQWRVVEVTLEPSLTRGLSTEGGTVTFGMVVDAYLDPQMAIDGIAALGEVFVVLDEPGFFSHDSQLSSVRQSGALLGTVSDSGELSMPTLGSDEFLGELDSVSEVREELKAPKTVEPATLAQGMPVIS